MTEVNHERISALVDGELGRAEALSLLSRIEGDPDLRRVWERYHRIGDALRAQPAPSIPAGQLVDRVRMAVEAEPTLYRFPTLRRGALRPLAGLALAASVAVVAVLGVRSFLDDPGLGAGAVAQRDAAPELGVPLQAGPGLGLVSAREAPGLMDARLSRYVINHSELAGPNVHGMLPYARIVAHDAGR